MTLLGAETRVRGGRTVRPPAPFHVALTLACASGSRLAAIAPAAASATQPRSDRPRPSTADSFMGVAFAPGLSCYGRRSAASSRPEVSGHHSEGAPGITTPAPHVQQPHSIASRGRPILQCRRSTKTNPTCIEGAPGLTTPMPSRQLLTERPTGGAPQLVPHGTSSPI